VTYGENNFQANDYSAELVIFTQNHFSSRRFDIMSFIG